MNFYVADLLLIRPHFDEDLFHMAAAALLPCWPAGGLLNLALKFTCRATNPPPRSSGQDIRLSVVGDLPRAIIDHGITVKPNCFPSASVSMRPAAVSSQRAVCWAAIGDLVTVTVRCVVKCSSTSRVETQWCHEFPSAGITQAPPNPCSPPPVAISNPGASLIASALEVPDIRVSCAGAVVKREGKAAGSASSPRGFR